MLQVKLPYYPKIEATGHATSFGVMEVEESKVYNKPLPNNKIIVRVDALDCLRDLLGDEPFICRELLYSVVAYADTKYDPQKVFASYYRKYKKVTAYVNESYIYGNDEIPLFERTMLPLRSKINAYKDDTRKKLEGMGGKYLVESKDFLYYAFNVKPDVTDLRGACIIC